MTIEQLAADVLRMLETQKQYFKTRSHDDLIKAKQAEFAVAKKCRDVVNNRQEALFEEPK
jgi:hypothetical protein